MINAETKLSVFDLLHMIRKSVTLAWWMVTRKGGGGGGYNHAFCTTTPNPTKCGQPLKNQQMKLCVSEHPRQKEEVASLFYLRGASKAVYKSVLLLHCFCAIILSSNRCWNSGWRTITLNGHLWEPPKLQASFKHPRVSFQSHNHHASLYVLV